MTNMISYLSLLREPIPNWLRDFSGGNDFDLTSFFKSRIVFYPGAASDGHAIRLFGSAHAAHCFVYADYLIEQQRIQHDLDSPLRRCRGYQTLFRRNLRFGDVFPAFWTPSRHHAGKDSQQFRKVHPYAFIEILERKPEYEEDHGAERLALLYLGADGHVVYDALFCQGSKPPFAVLLQDHGFGGNYDKFGAGGLMERIALESEALPDLMVVAEYTDPWQGYQMLTEVAPDPGGMHRSNRYLYANTRSTREPIFTGF